MNYSTNKVNGDKLSVLGMGCMRFTKKGPFIDQEKAEKELLYALENGINYFDTAYIYPGSEVALGKFIAKGYRSQMYIATKLPHYLYKSINDIEKCFKQQLSRLQTDYIDYYLIHMLTSVDSWNRLKQLGIEEWIANKKKSGQIKNIGFSFHGGTNAFKELIDYYDWEFCQIQYNYLDKYSQAGEAGLKYAAEKGLPVIIMEPLRGGRLVNKLPKGAAKIFENTKPQRSPAQWAFKWLWNQPEVTVVLSGMNSIEQIKENVKAASNSQPNELTDEELGVYDKVVKEINKSVKVPCTGCGYCMPCPQGVDIPVCFNAYNNIYCEGKLSALREYLMCTTLKSKPSNASICKKCGKCEKHCPQGIKIRDELSNASSQLEKFLYKTARRFAHFFAKY